MTETEDQSRAGPHARRQGRTARRLVRAANQAALSTLMAEEAMIGQPYGSLVSIATDHDGSPLLLLSTLSDHTRNLLADSRAGLLVEDGGEHVNPQTRPRVTLMGRLTPTGDPRHRARFLARHPGASLYADFNDFAFYKMTVERAHFVGGFARATWLGSILVSGTAAERMAETDSDICSHMNADHADAVDLYATLIGRGGSPWRMVGIDPDGFDIGLGETVCRVAFPAPVDGPVAAREALIALAAQAHPGGVPFREEPSADPDPAEPRHESPAGPTPGEAI